MVKQQGSLGFTLRKEDESVLGHYVRALVREPATTDGRIQPGDKIVAVCILVYYYLMLCGIFAIDENRLEYQYIIIDVVFICYVVNDLNLSNISKSITII